MITANPTREWTERLKFEIQKPVVGQHEVIEKLLEVKWWDKDIHTFRQVEENFWDVNVFLDKQKINSK